MQMIGHPRMPHQQKQVCMLSRDIVYLNCLQRIRKPKDNFEYSMRVI